MTALAKILPGTGRCPLAGAEGFRLSSNTMSIEWGDPSVGPRKWGRHLPVPGRTFA